MNNVMIGAIGAMSLTKYTSKNTPTEDLRYARVKLLKSQVKASKYDSEGYRLVTVKRFLILILFRKKVITPCILWIVKETQIKLLYTFWIGINNIYL